MENTTKRDFLIGLEKAAQKRWADEKVFEQNSPFESGDLLHPKSTQELEKAVEDAQKNYPKWLGTFPYPYMNGVLHIGHAFSASKIEFEVGFQRMLGKRALWPFGFHCTGMPIKASADKLIREIELFGPDFSGFKEEDEAEDEAQDKFVSQDKSKSAKSKAVAKTGGVKYQFQIMLNSGIPRGEIAKFADPQHWLKYFPPIAQHDVTRMGGRVDWRRSFVTTDANPYYDSFVRWQMNKLHREGKVKFGKRHTIYSIKDGQPCMDHDRSSGEGVGPQEYVGLKMNLVEWGPHASEQLKSLGQNIFFIAATLRPETSYGQTNCFVGPSVEYSIVAGPNGSAYLLTERAARNMAYQGLLAEQDKHTVLAKVSGKELIGSKVSAPNAVNDTVYVVPMDSISASKGTAVVTCVTADSPDDYITTQDLRKKAAFYGIDPAWVSQEPVSVIRSEKYGDFTAKNLVESMKINSPKDVKPLAEAKEIAYKDGFYLGIMNIGPYKGTKVQDAKARVREDLLKNDLAFVYSEPEGAVVSRSGDDCIVALTDQWYLNYGEDEWRATTEKTLANMNTYTQEVHNDFESVLGWLHEWACARSYGLGSKLPWDPQFLVESLSDSTIYMAYYTVAHLLHGPPVDGSRVGPLGITANDMTDEMWEYVLVNGPYPSNTTVPEDTARRLKAEFNYFYPMDLRSSAKDLIPNHLTLSLYNHSAIFPEKHWPVAMRANGHLLRNGEKMSKSKGNSMNLIEGIEKFGADAFRIAMADAGDSIEDANFDESVANSSILRLQNFVVVAQEQLAALGQYRRGNDRTIWDDIFENEMNQLVREAYNFYDKLLFKDAMRTGWYLFTTAKDNYLNACALENGPHQDLVKRYIELQTLLITPVAPHTAEHIWSDLLKNESSVQFARFPEVPPVDATISQMASFARLTIQRIRDTELTFIRRKNKKGPFDPSKPKGVALYVSNSYPKWQQFAVETVQKFWDPATKKTDNDAMRQYLTDAGVLKDKKTMPFISLFRSKVAELGEGIFDRSILFDQAALLNRILPVMRSALSMDEIVIRDAADADPSSVGYDARIVELAEPLNPSIVFYNKE